MRCIYRAAALNRLSTAAASNARPRRSSLALCAPLCHHAGAKLLRQIVEYAESHSSIADVFLHVRSSAGLCFEHSRCNPSSLAAAHQSLHNLSSVFAQVQINNSEALDFYKKQGFENVGQIDNYYKKIEPPHCFVLSKKFVHVNMGGRGGTLD